MSGKSSRTLSLGCVHTDLQLVRADCCQCPHAQKAAVFLIYSPCWIAAAQRQKRQAQERETLCFAQTVMVAVSASLWRTLRARRLFKELCSGRAALLFTLWTRKYGSGLWQIVSVSRWAGVSLQPYIFSKLKTLTHEESLSCFTSFCGKSCCRCKSVLLKFKSNREEKEEK